MYSLFQELDIAEWALPGDPMETCFHRWVLALLLSSTKLDSLTMKCDDIFWRPVLGLLALRHLEITTHWSEPSLALLVDVSFCQAWETLKILAEEDLQKYRTLPDILA